MENEVKLFMIFDILGDTRRSGPVLWCVDRERLEDIKDHILDLLLIARILKNKLDKYINYDKLYDYIICHDLPEAITGDITKFEGVSGEEIDRVTEIAINYLNNLFNGIIDIKRLINDFDNSSTLEAKVAKMIDKVHSATTFIKYQTEKNIDVDNPNIIKELRDIPFVDEKINEGMDVADIFYEYHRRAVMISDEECLKYHISREEANDIVDTILGFIDEFYKGKVNGTLLDSKKGFPKDAMIYNRYRD